MSYWLRGKRGGVIAWAVIAALVAGGLGWVTDAALRLEQEQLEARARAELQARLQLALSLLDSSVRPLLAREDSRPYSHYSAVYAPSVVLARDGSCLEPGMVLEPSPLLNADLPDWVLLHFQTDEECGWESPQVLSPAVLKRLSHTPLKSSLADVTPRRRQLLDRLKGSLPPGTLLATAHQYGAEPTIRDRTLVPSPPLPGQQQVLDNQFANSQAPNATSQQGVDPLYALRVQQRDRMNNESRNPGQKDNVDVANFNTAHNGSEWFGNNLKMTARGREVDVDLSPMVPCWLTADGADWLVVVRVVHIGDRQVCQGIVLDGPRLQQVLAAEVHDLFPDARILPVRDAVTPAPERTLSTMTALPLQLDPGPGALVVPAPGWTPLRAGLCLAWAAALVALLAVGLGGWSLLDLSERRIGFVSAVTHELRTPLTTLRLYLDMLTSGFVREETQREEYLRTLRTEADRLHRLVANVLDFSRLENSRPRLAKATVPLDGLLDQVRATWQGRCQDAGKELLVESDLDGEARIYTDPELVQQVLGNLIDNACKYSRGAADGRIWLRARREGPGYLVLEVEDRGPGVPRCERRSIFRPFRRGRRVEVTAGGVGLGLALAQRWAYLLGGRLSLHCPQEAPGACFRLELPLCST